MKKILILSCHGGGGHISAAQAITTILDNHYHITTVDIVGKEQAHRDPIYWITGKRYFAHDFYNFLLRHNKKRIVNLFYYIGLILIRLNKKAIEQSIERVFKREQPDLIISVVPLINAYIVSQAGRLNIPVIIIPTDLDIRTFVNNLPKKHTHTTITLAYDYPEISSLIDANTQKNYPIITTGFPIKPSFLIPKDTSALKKTLNIPDRPVILLIMGAAGSIALVQYVKYLFKSKKSFHLIVCVGRAYYLKNKITSLTSPSHISLSIADEHNDISDLMSIADICITKPGSVTFNENIYSHLPMLLDNTSSVLIWERLNINFLKKHQLGFVITSYSDIYQKVDQLLDDPSLLISIKNNFSKLVKKNIQQELPILVKNIFYES